MKTAVVIPAHNEAAAIGPLARAVSGLGFDCIVINDGSIDQTEALAAQGGAVVINTPAKGGKGNALKLGFDYAVRNNYEAVMAMDGDGQHSVSDIRLFTEAMQRTGADVICGNRMGDPKGMPWVRLATNQFMSWLISLICRQRIPDTQCGFRLVKTRVFKAIQLTSSDFEIETELLIKAGKKGFKIASVDIETIYRNEKSKIQPVRDTLRFIAYLWKELLVKND